MVEVFPIACLRAMELITILTVAIGSGDLSSSRLMFSASLEPWQMCRISTSLRTAAQRRTGDDAIRGLQFEKLQGGLGRETCADC